MNFSDILCFKI